MAESKGQILMAAWTPPTLAERFRAYARLRGTSTSEALRFAMEYFADRAAAVGGEEPPDPNGGKQIAPVNSLAAPGAIAH